MAKSSSSSSSSSSSRRKQSSSKGSKKDRDILRKKGETYNVKTKMQIDNNGQTKKRSLLNVDGLDDIVKKKHAEEDIAMKPVFLTKKQRQQLALERLEKRRQEEKMKLEQIEQQRRQFNKSSSSSSSSYSQQHRRDHHSRSNHNNNGRRNTNERTSSSSAAAATTATMNDRTLRAIRERYLGTKVEKKTRQNTRKQKYVFSWDDDEDTSQDINPLYQQRHNNSIAFGRGFIGGIDRREQLKKNTFYNELIEKRTKGKEDQRIMSKVLERQQRQQKRDLESKLQRLHWSEKALDKMDERDWRIMREDFNITTRGYKVPKPLRFWNESSLPDVILETLRKVGYEKPTPIQRAAIPIGILNRDCVGIAETGSGKTCAFILPMLKYISRLPPLTAELAENGPYAIVLAPTRELAQQIDTECQKFAKPMNIRCTSIVGGVSIQDQGFRLRLGVEIIIATPGRLFDCIERRYLVLNQCNYIVLDEADRMIDMNFEPQIIRIMDSMPSSNLRPESTDAITTDTNIIYRQTFMFSATMPPSVEKLANKYLRNPVFVAIGSRTGAASSHVRQHVELMGENAKRRRIIEVLNEHDGPIIVFCNTKTACDSLVRHLKQENISSVSLHGGKVQEQRMERLQQFKNGHFKVLVATDVVGRGIDINDITLVLNYDMANSIERYTHRIGRTGRAGKKGEAITFLTESDSALFYDLVKQLEQSNNVVPKDLKTHAHAKIDPSTILPDQKHKKQKKHT